MSYVGALQRVLSLVDFERMPEPASSRRYNLARMRRLAARLGNPQDATPAIHITGTKGKGSVAAMLSAILTACGFKTGLYTSPHLHTFCERIQVNGAPVSQKAFAALVDNLWPTVQQMGQEDPDGPPTTFELLTAMAFMHFRAAQCQFQVLEVGLGGRLDATNVITKPVVCVITSISVDHAQVLGSTVEQIAADKAGIIKPGSVVVCAPQPPGALAVVQDACRLQRAKLVNLGTAFQWEMADSTLSGQIGLVNSPAREYRVRIPLLGKHQLENAACALAAVEELQQQGFAVPTESALTGLSRTHWPARLEVLERNPLIVADGAHNPYAMRKMAEALDPYLPHHQRVLILGLTTGHDAEGIADEVARMSPMAVVATRSRHPRSLEPGAVAGLLRARGLAVTEAPNVADALRHARASATKADLIVGTGSLFVAAELREAVNGIPPELYPEYSAPQSVQRTV
ncbi:MAG: bifunctional folylpolyglutamate synthase/dihydrofolate synthase [Dehalococcoidia bacterium]|nr:bifunctional folylpolyglutamate synthase/dihydrofolate synthase [Dehalococcoidia bacterium]